MSILQENLRRNEALTAPDPLTPNGLEHSVRLRTDFPYWAASTVRIRHKTLGTIVPFILNRPQRKIIEALEAQRNARKPLRLITLKSRQWGCSTVLLYYTAWLQLYHFPNANSIIGAHVRDAAVGIRAMYFDLIENNQNDDDNPNPETHMTFGRFRGLSSTFIFQPANARVTVCSAQNPDAARGADFSIAHLSEVAYWPDTPKRPASNLVRSVCSSIPRVSNSMVVMESTANGAGGFFYQEWLRASQGQSDKVAIFAPWFLSELNAEPLHQPADEFFKSLDAYELSLWDRGATLEQILWYRNKLIENGGSRILMQREHPSTPAEAFCSSLPPVFDPEHLLNQQKHIAPPASADGNLQVWSPPCQPDQLNVNGGYIAAVDVGGNWEEADYSVVAVFDCRTPGRMELAAQWRGHVDIDHLCNIAADIAHKYHDALLVVEANSLEARGGDALERLALNYRNLYRRRCLDSVTGREESKFGFHTNRETKAAAMTDLIAAMRDGALIERSQTALDEMTTYVRTPRGNTEATHGCHDDLVMTRAIAAYALRQNPPRPRKPWVNS